MCGGTAHRPAQSASASGLSPRVRGNHLRVVSLLELQRSIPACAGEPLTTSYRLPPVGVYPRVCGGTADEAIGSIGRPGLSPRVRGNQRSLLGRGRVAGSIPACAGEPHRAAGGGQRPAVYPRVCGGTRLRHNLAGGSQGLSPRVRGNRTKRRTATAGSRSIPACAGEPRCRLRRIR